MSDTPPPSTEAQVAANIVVANEGPIDSALMMDGRTSRQHRVEWAARHIDASFVGVREDVARLTAALKESSQRDGNWLDKWGCCRVCDGEIPYGHTEGCDLYAMEKRERVLVDALKRIQASCPYDGSFQGGGISEFDDWTSGHRHISATCHRIASEALKGTNT